MCYTLVGTKTFCGKSQVALEGSGNREMEGSTNLRANSIDGEQRNRNNLS